MKRLRTVLQYLFFLGLGIFLAWLSLRNLNREKMEQIKTAVRNAEHWLIIPVFAILFLSHYVRALRWRLLIEPMGYQTSKANAFFAVMIGYFTNQAVPRLGEVVKCTVLSRYEAVPVDKLIGTIILERLIDALTLVVIFAITLAIQPELYSQLIDTMFHSSQKDDQKGISSWLILGAVFFLVLCGIAIWMFVRKKGVSDLAALLRSVWNSVLKGVIAIRYLKKRVLFLVFTIVLWSCYLAGGYLGFLALQETQQYGIKEAFSVLSAGSIGMIAAPGGIGAYAYLLQQTMQLYGLNSVMALAFGWILWLAQTSVIVIGGLFSFVALPYYNKKKHLDTPLVLHDEKS